jgi:uncharacterized protein YndB with AHSA1/START domain
MPDFEKSHDIAASPDATWAVVSDPHRLADWVPTARSSSPAGDSTVRLQGESHGHDYDTDGGFIADDSAKRLSWNSPRVPGYEGVLTVTGYGTGSRVTVRVTLPDVPVGAGTELERGLGEALDRIGRLTAAGD